LFTSFNGQVSGDGAGTFRVPAFRRAGKKDHTVALETCTSAGRG
jgi:hypothetical protein